MMNSNSVAVRSEAGKQQGVQNCLICGEDAAIAVRNRKSLIMDESFTQWLCRGCGSSFFDEQEHTTDLQQAYESFYDAQNSIERDREFQNCHYWRNEVSVIRRLHGSDIGSVLDIGCHHGDFLLHWPDHVERVGSELAPSCAEIARNRGLTVHDGFIEGTEFDQEFDVVSCYAVIEHLRDPVAFLQTLPRLTAKNGIVAILIPTFECFKRSLLDATGIQWHMFSPPLHLSFLSRAFLDQLMQRQGFRRVGRRFTSGGIFNPFRRLPILDSTFARGMSVLDSYSPTNRIPIFDHMYSYYSKL